MRVTSCPDCGEVVELPASDSDDEQVEVTCPTCGLSGSAEEWHGFTPEDEDTLLGRPLAHATIPATVPRSWSLRVEQLEEIRDVVVELQYQIRLLRQALDELNEDLPERVKRWVASLQSECVPAGLPEQSLAVCRHADPQPPAAKPKVKKPAAKPKATELPTSQSGLW